MSYTEIKATEFEKECSLMSGYADNSVRSGNNKYPMPTGYTILENLDNVHKENSNLDYTCFQSTDGNKIIIAFASTSDGDKGTDAQLCLGITDVQLLQAAELYMYIKSRPGDAEITFTGFSLGGGLAALLGAFFNVNAVVFDPAPFGAAAKESIRDSILNHLQGIDNEPKLFSDKTYSIDEINYWASGLTGFTNGNLNNRWSKVNGYYVEGELCRTGGTVINVTKLEHGNTTKGPYDLHTLSLLSAFLLDDRLREMTYSIPELLDMLLDKYNLYHREKNNLNNKEGFLERLVRHQKGVTANPDMGINPITADNMLTRFTNDLEKIANRGRRGHPMILPSREKKHFKKCNDPG